ncbi:MAG: hypothetical protein WD648_15520 [Planctomycetaceae bacterium]
MSFLLCHECYSWVEPIHDRCPDCQESVDSSTADPPLSRLQNEIGNLIGPLGEVKVERRLLPDRGLLYLTSNGLFFLPHAVEHEMKIVPTTDVQTSFLWSLAALAWTPLALVVPFLKKKRETAKQVRVFRPHWLSVDQSQEMPKLLMQNPGVFFLPNNAVRVVGRRRKGWRIVRVHGPALRIFPLDDARQFHDHMSRLIAAGIWTEG